LTFFPEGKAVADWRAFEDVFAGRVAVKGGPEGKAVGAIGAEKVKAGAEAVMEGCRNLNLERGIFRWDSENPFFFRCRTAKRPVERLFPPVQEPRNSSLEAGFCRRNGRLLFFEKMDFDIFLTYSSFTVKL